MRPIALRSILYFALAFGLGSCGDDGPPVATDTGTGAMDASVDAGSDSGIAGMDASSDGGGDLDAGMDASIDAATNDAATIDAATIDAGTIDAAADGGSDGGADAGSCGMGPACAVDETCWGAGCSCIVEIDGDSYLRTDGAAVYYLNTPQVLAETAPGTPLTGAVQIMDGWRHTCGLVSDGTVWCWGKGTANNPAGELGNGTIGGATTPMLASQVLTAAATPLTGIARLNDRNSSRCYIERTTCGIRGADGAVFCWGGDNSGGGTGSFYTEGTVGSRPYATQIMLAAGVPLTNVEQIELGLRHACARTSTGEVLCWGMNVGGPLGQGDQTTRQYPTTVSLPGGLTADEIGVGSDFSCARSGDAVHCWGASGHGQIGLGDPTAPENHDGCINFCRLTPARVIDAAAAPLVGVVELEVNYLGACARMTDDTLRCWGDGVGNVATEPTVFGSMLTEVAQMTSCSSNAITTSIRYVQRDGTLHIPSRMVDPICP